MIRQGCGIDGHLNDAKFSEPMPWIGIYIAAASLLCAVAMATDLIQGLRHRKLWFPCKFFSLNATSLTLITVATKLSIDLNTPMPRRQDQLSKLSSTVFVCTVMGNLMPSLGIMETQDLFMNLMALAILVVTVVVNICIELGTGVIYVFFIEHVLVMFLMLVLLAILCFSAITVPTTKQHLEVKYKKKYQMALTECKGRTGTDKLKDDLVKYWIMAYTCSPQFVIGRSVTCTASGALCLLSALTLAEAMVRSYFMPGSLKFCSGDSDYKWSIILSLISHTIAIGVGTIAPTIRWFMAINYRRPIKEKKTCTKGFKVERFWIQYLLEIKEIPSNFTLRIQSRFCRKCIHSVKNKILDLLIIIQYGIVLSSKAIQLISISLTCAILTCCEVCKIRNKNRNSVSGLEELPVGTTEPNNLGRFVLHLEGEDVLVDLMTQSNCQATSHWIQKGKKEQPENLIKLLEKSTSKDYRGIKNFDDDDVPRLDNREPPNCWALPLVTLTSIAVALPDINPHQVKKLLRAVNEALRYVKVIEHTIDSNGECINLRKAADVVWLGLDLYHKWFDVDLRNNSDKTPKEILETFSDVSKQMYFDSKQLDIIFCLKESPSKWPIKVLAANSMYRISKTILLNHDNNSERLFETIETLISDILGACFTNIPNVISVKCLSTAIEAREESVRQAAFHLGKSEKVLKIIGDKSTPDLGHAQLGDIDEWRSFYKYNHLKPCVTSSFETKTVSNDSCINFD